MGQLQKIYTYKWNPLIPALHTNLKITDQQYAACNEYLVFIFID